jgi:hypothetical protein
MGSNQRYLDTLGALNELTDSQLRSLNHAVCDTLKGRRQSANLRARHKFTSGDRVSFNGRNGYTEGTVVRVKRTKAIINIGELRDWNVPLGMLELVQ